MSAGNSVINHKTLSTDRLSLTVPEKYKGKYVSYLANGASAVYVQTPVLTVAKVIKDGEHASHIRFKYSVGSPFAEALQRLDDYLVETVTKRSADFFSGKRFSRQWIEGRYEAFVKGSEVSFTVPDSTKLLIKDQRGVDRSIDEVKPGMKAIGIVHFPGVSFSKTSIQPDAELVQMKVYVEEKIPWSILDRDSDDEAAPALEPDEATIDEEEVDREVSALELDKLGIAIKEEDLAHSERAAEGDRNDDEQDFF